MSLDNKNSKHLIDNVDEVSSQNNLESAVRKTTPDPIHIKKIVKSDIFKCVIVLVAIATVAGLLLGLFNWLTYVDPIMVMKEKISKHYSVSVESIQSAEDMIVNVSGSKNLIRSCYSVDIDEKDIGIVTKYVYQAVGSGAKSGTIVLLIYINHESKIEEIQVQIQKESPGYMDDVVDKMRESYIGVDVTTIDTFTIDGDAPTDVDGLTGSTMTSRAYNNAINAAVYSYKNSIGEVS